MVSSFWLVKQEPEAYSWSTFVHDGRTVWTGVRNFQARNNLRAMKRGDRVLYYHSVSDRQVVGIAKVEREAYPDPTAKEGDWSCVDLTPHQALPKSVSLDQLKADPITCGMALIRQTRLSVTPMTHEQFQRILEMSGLRKTRGGDS